MDIKPIAPTQRRRVILHDDLSNFMNMPDRHGRKTHRSISLLHHSLSEISAHILGQTNKRTNFSEVFARMSPLVKDASESVIREATERISEMFIAANKKPREVHFYFLSNQ